MGLPVSTKQKYVNNRDAFLKLPGVRQRLEQMSQNLNVPIHEILATIEKETAGSYSSSQKNLAGGSAVGLIQFMPDNEKSYKTIGGVQYPMSKIAGMSELEQLNLVESYISETFNYRGVDSPKDGDFSKAVTLPASLTDESYNNWKNNYPNSYKKVMKNNPAWVGEDGIMTTDTISNYYTDPNLYNRIQTSLKNTENSNEVLNNNTQEWNQNLINAVDYITYPKPIEGPVNRPINNAEDAKNNPFLKQFGGIKGPWDFKNGEQWVDYVEEKINELPWETNPVLKTLSNIKQQIISLDDSDKTDKEKMNLVNNVDEDTKKYILTFDESKRASGKEIKQNFEEFKVRFNNKINEQIDKLKNGAKNFFTDKPKNGSRNSVIENRDDLNTIAPSEGTFDFGWSYSKPLRDWSKKYSGKEILKRIWNKGDDEERDLVGDQKAISLTLKHVAPELAKYYDLSPESFKFDEDGQLSLTPLENVVLEDGSTVTNKTNVLPGAGVLGKDIIRQDILFARENSPYWNQRNEYLLAEDPLFNEDGSENILGDDFPESDTDAKRSVGMGNYFLKQGIYIDDDYTDGTPNERGYTGRKRKVAIKGKEFNVQDPTTWKWQWERVGIIDENGNMKPGSEDDANNFIWEDITDGYSDSHHGHKVGGQFEEGAMSEWQQKPGDWFDKQPEQENYTPPTKEGRGAKLIDTALTMLKAGAGIKNISEAMKEIDLADEPELSEMHSDYMRRLRELSGKGFSAEEMRKYKGELRNAYTSGVKQAMRASGGSRANMLASLGVLNANRVKGLVDLAAKDAELNRENMKNFGDALKTQETLNWKSGELSRQYQQAEQGRIKKLKGDLGNNFLDALYKDIETRRLTRPGSAYDNLQKSQEALNEAQIKKLNSETKALIAQFKQNRNLNDMSGVSGPQDSVSDFGKTEIRDSETQPIKNTPPPNTTAKWTYDDYAENYKKKAIANKWYDGEEFSRTHDEKGNPYTEDNPKPLYVIRYEKSLLSKPSLQKKGLNLGKNILTHGLVGGLGQTFFDNKLARKAYQAIGPTDYNKQPSYLGGHLDEDVSYLRNITKLGNLESSDEGWKIFGWEKAPSWGVGDNIRQGREARNFDIEDNPQGLTPINEITTRVGGNLYGGSQALKGLGAISSWLRGGTKVTSLLPKGNIGLPAPPKPGPGLPDPTKFNLSLQDLMNMVK